MCAYFMYYNMFTSMLLFLQEFSGVYGPALKDQVGKSELI